MKRLVYLLMPVMPGFNAWAVEGFIERDEKSGDTSNKVEPIPHDALKKLVDGFDCPASNVVFVPYEDIPVVLRKLSIRSSQASVQPLDRGGILMRGDLTEDGWSQVSSCIGYDPSPSVDSNASKSK